MEDCFVDLTNHTTYKFRSNEFPKKKAHQLRQSLLLICFPFLSSTASLRLLTSPLSLFFFPFFAAQRSANPILNFQPHLLSSSKLFPSTAFQFTHRNLFLVSFFSVTEIFGPSMSTQTASSSSSSSSSSFSSSLKYDVFLSFCSVDTCKNFTDHLYTALRRKGIITFRNDDEIHEQGKYISSQLLKAIEESKYAIIVLSTNYASSRWCLIQLAKIIKCIEETKLIVFPIFYHVDPFGVRNQTGTLAEAFEKHEKDPKINKEDVQAWKAALKELGNISGWDLHDR